MARRAEKLFYDMKASQANWKPVDLKHLVTGFGFHIRSGGNHDIFIHPKYRWLMGTIPRHNKVDKAYVRDAVRCVEELLSLEQGERRETDHGKSEE